ncbi:hypothetical protein HG530_009214 [Fusarium avenaceum]|nr:hypothetical protein HG530_009214 [Fusarium avenaceum]
MTVLISEPITLGSGLTLPNRLAKAAMAENLADENLLPTEELKSAYKTWANGGWGLIITGNVQVDPRHLGQARDIANNDATDRVRLLNSWKEWASASKSEGTPTVTLAPSAVPLRLGKGLFSAVVSALLFGTPRAMTIAEILDVQDRFVKTAVLAAEAGFDGIELHAAHGYLLSQFLTSATNKRTDQYGVTPAGRAKFVVDTIKAIRAAVPPGFTVGIKFNSVDHQSSLALEECVEQLQLITQAGLDFLEISGGSYEEPIGIVDPEKVKAKKESTIAREAFFLDFATVIRDKFPGLPLLVTGGFRTRKTMDSALESGALDLVGIARPAVLNPLAPTNTLLEEGNGNARVTVASIKIPWLLNKIGNYVIGAGYETAWYVSKIKTLASRAY